MCIFLMGEGRFVKLGRFEAQLVCFVIDSISEVVRRDYTVEFLREVERYSILPRKEGTPINEGCVNELDGLENLNVYSPRELARLVKERLHTKYQKQSSKRERDSLLSYIRSRYDLVIQKG